MASVTLRVLVGRVGDTNLFRAAALSVPGHATVTWVDRLAR